MTIAVKSEVMTPIVEETVQKWKCRHCKHRWPIDNPEAITNPELRPKQCANRDCRAMDWDRPKKKEGRPSKRKKAVVRPKGTKKKKGK
jgi:hypothetical protein